MISLIFAMVLSTYIKTEKIESDMQAIKEKLGIKEIEEAVMTNEEIERELEDEALHDEMFDK
ncbi:hypothetical protein [Paenibacillus sp. sgz500958]|uniref:hypothetical protein n=1 Tax=Paenibacillus sp. sgz500958 TaxID=3242475 RepID=UPI0036D2CDB0